MLVKVKKSEDYLDEQTTSVFQWDPGSIKEKSIKYITSTCKIVNVRLGCDVNKTYGQSVLPVPIFIQEVSEIHFSLCISTR